MFKCAGDAAIFHLYYLLLQGNILVRILYWANLLLNVNMLLTLHSNFFPENLLKKTKSKGENMIENVDGTKMIRRVYNVEKTGFCDVGCGAGL